ncbi:SAM-dependent methyltransferase [Streptomyces armeniacus]|uniref:SAM-dependent methyltransferase n=1 Tax=Streptomyces armeniacus TaxID=83291 RepID=A0A345XLH8_9ACTN|nr:SAM-dependent methyltransferase [Streptomyces armeniacus]AXK32494.1 SAM-dependent methyltransferase [Streptomyces armeniacus]
MTDSPEQSPRGVDTTVPHSARVWNHWLGGKDNYKVDQELSARFCEVFPGIVDLARTSRYFLVRTVRYLAEEAGVRQFLDIGTGLPTADNTHQVAQRCAPESKVVYVDNDPLVLAHARALLTSTPEGTTQYIDADLHDPDRILRIAGETLDFSQPVALTMMQTVGHVADYAEARALVDRLMAALPSGSYLALNDSVDTHKANAEATARYNDSGAVPYQLRSHEQIAGFFTGLELVEPGVVALAHWRPDFAEISDPAETGAVGGVGRKP